MRDFGDVPPLSGRGATGLSLRAELIQPSFLGNPPSNQGHIRREEPQGQLCFSFSMTAPVPDLKPSSENCANLHKRIHLHVNAVLFDDEVFELNHVLRTCGSHSTPTPSSFPRAPVPVSTACYSATVPF